MKFLTVGDLKEVLKDIPDDYIMVVYSDADWGGLFKISAVTQLHCEFEDDSDAIGFVTHDYDPFEMSGCTTKILFSSKKEDDE